MERIRTITLSSTMETRIKTIGKVKWNRGRNRLEKNMHKHKNKTAKIEHNNFTI